MYELDTQTKQSAAPIGAQPSTGANNNKEHHSTGYACGALQSWRRGRRRALQWMINDILPMPRAWLRFVPESEDGSPNTEPSVYFLSSCPALTLSVCFPDHFNCPSLKPERSCNMCCLIAPARITAIQPFVGIKQRQQTQLDTDFLYMWRLVAKNDMAKLLSPIPIPSVYRDLLVNPDNKTKGVHL